MIFRGLGSSEETSSIGSKVEGCMVASDGFLSLLAG
jgi:hypothetical protein